MFAYNYKNIVLRDLTERDIPDRIRWLTEEPAWGDWDAPNEPIEPMIHVAESLGFAECNRIIGNRAVRGGVYDTITFRLNFKRFNQYFHHQSSF
ncbi:MAG: hypothetical protein LIO78_06020 [Clostridiales bacterium]|nr:hypothetical protein [Clostridiales bacterium]